MLAFQRKHLVPPTFRAICLAFNFKSMQSVAAHLRPLVKKGLVMHMGSIGQSHSRIAIYPDDRCPICGRKPLGKTEWSRETKDRDPALDPAPRPEPDLTDMRLTESHAALDKNP
jgi:hypothetical protein